MAELNLPNIREGGNIRFRIGLEDGGVAVDWSGLEDIRVFLYADAQKQVSGEMCEVAVDEEDNTVLKCKYSGDDVQYRGINSVLVRAKYLGEIKVYDKPAINIVARTSDATGVVEIDDPVVPVQISVEDVSTSLLNNAIDAAINAAAEAEKAAHLVPLQVLEDCVEATGKALEAASKAPYIDETTGNWFVWDAEAGEYVDSGKTARGATGNGIASWSVVESSEDAGNNVVTVTFTDGTSESFNVKNGHTGNGIASIVQTVESPDDAGTNVITITMTNGTVVTFNVKNGSKGTPGVAQAAYKSVSSLPTASAQTMDKIYLTPSGTSGVYNMSYTEFDGSAYSWQDLGTTAIQLSDYATKAELDQLEAKVVEKDTLFVDSQINYFDIEDLSVESQGADITYSVSEGVLTIVNAGANNQNIGLYLPDTISGKVFVLKVNASPARSVILYKGISTDYEVLLQDGTEYSIEYSGNNSGYWFRITVGNNKTCVVSSITLEEKNPDQYINPELVKEIGEASFSEEYREKQAKLFSNGNIFDVETATIIGVGSKITYTRENNTIKVVSSGSGAGNNYINIGLPNTKTGKIYTLSFRATNTRGTMDLYRGLSVIVETVSAINDVYTVVFPGGYDYLIKLTVSSNKTSIMSEFNLIDNSMAGKTFVNPKAMMYDNGNSTLMATLVNDAIDELDQKMRHRIFDNDYNAQVNNRLANPLYETLEHYNTGHPDSPIVVEDVLVRGVIPAEARRYRIPTTIITNALTYLVAAEHRGDVVAGDATDASIHLARKEAGSNTWEYQNIIPFVNYTTSYGRTYDPSFVIDRTGENTGAEGRIFLFGGMSTNDGSWITDTEETNDLMYKYSDDDGETWSALVSVKSIVDYTKIDCILTSPNNGIQMADGTLVVPCFCSLKTEGAFKCSTVLLIKENAGSWKLSSITPSDFNIAECAIVETEDGKILLAARTIANFGAVNEETKYSFLWEYDVDSDTWEKKNSTFVENSGCQWSLTKAVFSINGTPTTVYLKSAVDSVNALRTNITIWASLDLNKWIRVYRVYAPSGNGYSVVDFYDDKMVVAYETSVDNYSISFQDISDVLDIVDATTENYLVGNVCIQDMLQYIINLLRN